MNKLLQKLEWRLHRVNLKFTLLDLYLHDGDGCIGFTFFEFTNDYRPYALLALEFRLPNGAERRITTITNWDFLFLSTPLWKWVRDTDERKLWGSTLTKWELFWLKTLSKLFK